MSSLLHCRVTVKKHDDVDPTLVGRTGVVTRINRGIATLVVDPDESRSPEVWPCSARVPLDSVEYATT